MRSRINNKGRYWKSISGMGNETFSISICAVAEGVCEKEASVELN
jgi:hypothetical protein